MSGRREITSLLLGVSLLMMSVSSGRHHEWTVTLAPGYVPAATVVAEASLVHAAYRLAEVLQTIWPCWSP